jgi:dCTP deaminase
MGVLTKYDIWEALCEGQTGHGLVITPLVNRREEIGDSAVDLHLGHEFIVFKRAKSTAINVRESKQFAKNPYIYQAKERISRGQKFVLHPHQLALGASIEYISLPSNLSGDIKGRSTWGRTGLIIATATKVDPSFKGCVTLELVNEGEVPLVLYPGLSVAQLILTTTKSPAVYKGRYRCPTGPQFPKLDKELKTLPSFYEPIE